MSLQALIERIKTESLNLEIIELDRYAAYRLAEAAEVMRAELKDWSTNWGTPEHYEIDDLLAKADEICKGGTK